MEAVDEICDLLQVHKNRDKIVLLACYTLKLCGTSLNRPSLLKASSSLANTRAILRLFDDASVLQDIRKYGLGKQDGLCWGAVGVAGGLFTLAYLQAEKLMWLLDSGVLVLDEKHADRVRITHKLFWSLYTFAGFVKSLQAVHRARQNMQKAQRTKCAPVRLQHATLTSAKYLMDFVHAVSWLPRGWLWGSAVQTSHAAALATTSALLNLIIHYQGKKLLQRHH